MFVNRSIFPAISGPMTSEVMLLLSSYQDLIVHPGERSEGVDAMLIGIIDSSEHMSDAKKTTALKLSDGEYLQSIGSRSKFYFPSTAAYYLTLRLVLIKNPSTADKQAVYTPLVTSLNHHPKVIFSKEIPLTASFNKIAADGNNADEGGVVNFTQNHAIMNRKMKELSLHAADTLKKEVLDAF